MKKKTTYAGAVKNQGSQIVKAPLRDNSKGGKTVAKKGNDIRNDK